MVYYIGVDIGGTFTDLVVMDQLGQIQTFKSETTPHNLLDGIWAGLQLAAQSMGLDVQSLLRNCAYFGHGTTVATNAFLERKGVKTGLITTKGFGDTIFLQRMMGMTAGLSPEEVLNLAARSLPVPIVPRDLVLEITERIDYKGHVVVPLHEEEVREAARRLREEGVAAIAVCLLWSFRNNSHEKQIQNIIAEEAPGVFVTLSHVIAPMIKEYERTATSVVNSYLGPVVNRYMTNVEESLQGQGLQSPLLIMNSSGGVISSHEAAEKVVTLLFSGPAGGVVGCLNFGQKLGYENIIATDMGGTSFDAGLVIEGEAVRKNNTEIGKYHLLVPMINIASIGVGGGSIATIEKDMLKVGPKSAGAVPGPACYDKGGELPTVTDADVVLGFINPGNFLGGRKKLNKAKAEGAIAKHVAEPIGLSLVEAAISIRKIIDNKMADLLRKITIEKGYDPRDFAIFAYGGAGPTHCSSYALELCVGDTVIPVTSMVHSAFGAVASDIHYTFEKTELMQTKSSSASAASEIDGAKLERTFAELEKQAECQLLNHVDPARIVLKRSINLRYRRQVQELVLSLGEIINENAIAQLIQRFHAKYEEVFGEGSAFTEAGLEITTLRVDAWGIIPKPTIVSREGQGKKGIALKGERKVYFTEEGFLTPVYAGEKLAAGEMVPGPAIIEYSGTTVVVDPLQTAEVDNFLNIVISK